jgi:hypothetical protein
MVTDKFTVIMTERWNTPRGGIYAKNIRMVLEGQPTCHLNVKSPNEFSEEITLT